MDRQVAGMSLDCDPIGNRPEYLSDLIEHNTAVSTEFGLTALEEHLGGGDGAA